MAKYRPGVQIYADKESAFNLQEKGYVEHLQEASSNSVRFYQLMTHLANGPYKLSKKDGKIMIANHEPEGARRLTNSELTTLIADVNGVSILDASRALQRARGNYETATKMIEARKGMGVEVKQIPNNDNYGDSVLIYLRDSWENITEWADPEVIASNVFDSTDARDAVPDRIEGIDHFPEEPTLVMRL